ncbi:lachesin-like [Homalodisca vitripennis]|nr:lachesin-like [Homalodisca vitripennis]
MYLGSVSAVPSKPSEDTGMAHWPVSKTLSLLGVAILVHLIVMTSLADRGPADEGTGDRPKRSVDPKRHRGSENTLAQDQNGRAAVFATENSTVVTAQITSTATLPCVVRKFGTGVVSWIRRKDFQLLTVGLATYSSDDRFMVEHARHLQNWGLQIHKVQKTDAGMYECQVSTHPPTSIFVELKVIEASADILGSPDLHIKSGSQLRLVCTLRQSTEAPVYVFWYHGDRMINYDKERGVSVLSDRKSSVLAINAADKADSGNYTCVPSNAKPASINVHVLNGEKPAAMQHGGRSSAPRAEGLTPLGVLLAYFLSR